MLDKIIKSCEYVVLYAILKYVKERNITDFSNITKEEFKEMLKGNIEIPLFEERYNILKNVSKIAHENKRKCGNGVDKYI